MSGPRNTEPQANGALARALRRRNPDWNDNTVHAERTHVIQQAVLALFTVGDVYVSSCKRVAYALFSAQRRSRALFWL